MLVHFQPASIITKPKIWRVGLDLCALIVNAGIVSLVGAAVAGWNYNHLMNIAMDNCLDLDGHIYPIPSVHTSHPFILVLKRG